MSPPTISTSTASRRWKDLLQRNVTCIVITHDRRFLDQVANSIAELDRGILRTFPGNYSVYEERKAEINIAEDLAHRRFEKFWAQEEVWIRKGVEARRTRNEGRVKRLEHLREERAARRERIGQIKLTVDTGERSGKLVAELENVGKSFGDRRDPRRRLAARDARRSRRLVRPERRRQDHHDQADRRHARAGQRARAAWHQPAGGLLRSAARPARSRTHAGRNREPRFRLGADRREPQTHLQLPAGIPVRQPPRQCADPHVVRRRAQPPAAGAAVRAARPTCWCSTSPPTISTSTRSSCSKPCWSTTPARCCW